MNATEFAQRRATAELDLLAEVLAAHKPGLTIAEQAGVTAQTFAQDDARLIWLAIDVARAEPKGAVLQVARAALRWGGLWDESWADGAVGPTRWTAYRLSRLASCGTFEPNDIAIAAARLVNMAIIEAQAAEHLAIARRLLREVA